MYPYLPYNWYSYFNGMYNPTFLPYGYYDDFNDFEGDFIDSISERNGDPPPICTNNPPSTALVLRKEMTGYPNYGNPSGNADILYTGNTCNWTFNIPPFLSAALNRFRRIELVIRGALDDHYNVPENRYTMSVSVNNRTVRTGPTPYVHGRPAGQRFDNWNQLILQINPRNIQRNNRVTIRNTSNTGDTDFIAFDWMEMRFYL